MRIVVVGAGIAGLAAAWALQPQEVPVLEAGAVVGGRLRSEPVHGYPLECGAQFLSARYTVVPRLVRAAGLTTATVRADTAVLRDGVLCGFRGDRPWSQFTGGLLPWRAAPRAAAGLARVRAATRGRATSDLTRWADHDGEPARAWATRVLGAEVTDRILAPTVHGFYFQELDESSAALPAAVSAFGVRPGATLTIAGGLGRLTRRLAARLDVRLDTAVTSVRRVGSRAVVTTAAGEELVDRVILAVPGAAARAILRDPTDRERRLMATPYSQGLLVGVPLGRRLRPHQLAGAYGVLVHPAEASPLAAVAVASRAHPDGGDRDLLTVMFRRSATAALRTADSATISATACRELGRIDPTLRPLLPADPGVARVVRHREAMPTCPRGHASAVLAYRRQLAADPVVLAGDYLGFPWTDSAAATGLWAAAAALA